MVRSAAAIIAVLILPSFAQAQTQQGAHTVVRDDTLWDLAQRYYSNPFEWRTIWEANRGVIQDPNLIYPAQVLTIPGRSGTAQTAQVPPAGQTPPPPATGATGGTGTEPPSQASSAAEARTIFYRDATPAPSVVAMLEREYVAVDVDQVYSAPWLGPISGDPEHLGVLRGFALDTDRGSTLRQFHQVVVDTREPVRVGDQLRTFRVTQSIAQVGQIATPTGVLTVTAIQDGGAIAVVTKEYGRIQPGDFVGGLPPYSMEAGVRAQDVTGGSEAMVMGFAGTAQLRDIGHHGFLDLGSDHGVGVGDEFVLYSDAVRTEVRGRLQVVGVMPTSSTVRVSTMTDDVFRQGVIVKLVRQMP